MSDSSTSASLDLLPEHVQRPAAGSRTWDRLYEEVARLGSGGYADVFRARHRGTGTEAAVKVSLDDEDARARLRREIDEQRKLKSSHVMPVLDAGEGWYAMPVAEGTLAALAYELSNDERVHVVDQVAEGLACAHEEKIVHRDVTPNNILRLVRDGGSCWVIGDFGLVKRRPGQTSGPRTRGAVGTPGFIAPEVLGLGGHGADPRADIFSLGQTIIFMLTGKPREGDTPLTVPTAWLPLVEKMTVLDRNERIQTMAEVRSGLTEVQARLRAQRRTRWGSSDGDQALTPTEVVVLEAILALDGDFRRDELRARLKGRLLRSQITIGVMGLYKRGLLEPAFNDHGEQCGEQLTEGGRDWVLNHRELFEPRADPDDPSPVQEDDDIPF
ncbi:MAG TPA: serine/threonine-protein kinase [Polyangia bacterium]|jgi:serine/threonine protein kinase